MGDSETRRGKIELTIGNLSFVGEGDQDWLDQQISRLIDTFKPVHIDSSVDRLTSGPDSQQNDVVVAGSLASYLKAKRGDTVQVQRFLATAAWLHRRGEKPLTTKAVIKALKDNQQKRLGNPADCLNQNAGRGFCEKTNEGFFITPEGWRQLDEDQDQ